MKQKAIEQFARLLSHPDLARTPKSGSTYRGDSSFISAPSTSVRVNATRRKPGWTEVDALEPHRWMRVHVFGTSSALVGFAAVEYFSAEHVLSFDAPGFTPLEDMLLMVAGGSSAQQLTRRLYGVESAPSVTEPGAVALGGMVALARGFSEHNFAAQLETTARERNRSRLYMHVEGDTARYKRLTDSIGFTTTAIPGATLFTKEVTQ